MIVLVGASVVGSVILITVLEYYFSENCAASNLVLWAELFWGLSAWQNGTMAGQNSAEYGRIGRSLKHICSAPGTRQECKVYQKVNEDYGQPAMEGGGKIGLHVACTLRFCHSASLIGYAQSYRKTVFSEFDTPINLFNRGDSLFRILCE
ncbi:hypothetical protein DFH07DRAFT_765692 [Mycena maculata]|uniref:Uncharacterized protein n=1 Tax=Mycena maculata TaxID=230809 RepID=A0AAD7K6U5_9AGAR|nr:hypothetical protein DFH07DRAFT_765692 [Mycena maculata]